MKSGKKFLETYIPIQIITCSRKNLSNCRARKSSRALLTPSKTGFFYQCTYVLLVWLRSLGQGFTKPVFRRTLDSFLEGTNIWFSFDIGDLVSKDSICVWLFWKKKIWLVNGLPNMWSKESMNSRQMKTDILFSDFQQVYKFWLNWVKSSKFK